MANAKLQVVDKLKPFTPMLRALMDGMDELAKIGSIEQAGDEAQARVDRLAKQENDHKARLGDIASSITAAQRELDAKATERETRTREYDRDLAALRARQQASLADEAAASRSAADEQARQIKLDAEAKAAALLKAAKDEASQHEARASASREVLAATNAELVAAQGRHDELNRHIESMRAKIKAL